MTPSIKRQSAITETFQRYAPVCCVCLLLMFYMTYLYQSTYKVIIQPQELPPPVDKLFNLSFKNNKDNIMDKAVDNHMDKQKIKMKGNYTLLFWESIPDYFPKIDFSSCLYSNCRVSTRKEDLQKSHAVIFYAPHHRKNSVPVKQNGQTWILSDWESPVHVGGFQHLHKKINWTWTYRRDSDIVSTYGKISTKADSQFNDVLLKNKSFAWFVSNCHTHGGRDRYVNLMQKYSTVDIYGSCGELKCQRNKDECRNLLQYTYNFYLSFENSLCKDYLTEKTFQRLKENVLPITRGGANYSLYLPPNSYIDTRRYPTVQNMTQDILHIGTDQTLYSKFHKWRRFYESYNNIGISGGFCEICKRLNFQDKFKRLYEDVHTWWVGNEETGAICSPPKDIK